MSKTGGVRRVVAVGNSVAVRRIAIGATTRVTAAGRGGVGGGVRVAAGGEEEVVAASLAIFPEKISTPSAWTDYCRPTEIPVR